MIRPNIFKNQRKPYYLGLIPARGGSKRIPRKNMALLGGKPLISYSIEAALNSRRLSKVLVSTDDKEIAEYSRSQGADVPFLRPEALARDQSPTIEAVQHALAATELSGTRVDAVVVLQATSPFRPRGAIDRCIDLFESSRADTVTAVSDAKHHPYRLWKLTKQGAMIPFSSMRHLMMARNKLPQALMENGALYIINRSTLQRNTLYGRKVVPFIMDQKYSLDIDTPEDLQWGEFLYQHMKHQP